jgi:O-antigen/teichoic acid export membrane protein
MTLADVLIFTTVLAAAISTGGMWLFLVGILPIREQMITPNFVHFHQLSSPLIDRFVPTGIVVSTILAAITAVVGDAGSTATFALVVGALVSLVVIAISLRINFPINKTVKSWSLNEVPGEWSRLFDERCSRSARSRRS